MNHLRDLEVLVLGLGDSGLAMARWCARHGARVRVWDSREQPPQAAALAEAAPGTPLLHGDLDAARAEALLAEVQLVLKSPGLSPLDARIAPLLQAARARGTALAGELDLFARALADLQGSIGYAPKVLAITGTNGKTTTTSLTALLVERCGLRVGLAGNIGPTLLDTLARALDAEPPRSPEADATVDDGPAPAVTAVQASDVPDAAAAMPVDADEAAPADADGDGDAPAPRPDDAADAPPALRSPVAAAPIFEVLPEVWVLELSSFQLDGGGFGVQGFAPSAAVVLNITQDHLDWHGDMAAYAAAKRRVYGGDAADAPTVMVVNRDDAAVRAMVPAPLQIKGTRGVRGRSVERAALRFGLDAPTRPGDFGLVTENGMAWLVRAREVDETLRKAGGRKAAAEDEEISLQRLMPADALRIRGRHNASNALAALSLCTAIGCPLAPMLHGLREYGGEPHRVEYVATVGEVEAFDDSKGTNVGATVAALTGLGADRAPSKLVVILGGDGKGQDFSPLAAPVAGHVRAVALIGRDAAAIEAALGGVLADAGVPAQRCDSLEAAVRWSFEQAHAGDAVLLSPACASLDMFRNYAHRAEVFIEAVRTLLVERGEELI
ncbi:UDP-N-acetylmuramoyl-L-alanine--D-glutamate ligase [Pseudaquabacterium rugosum]|uniref:UDP-N-acetylmuramoylalanine--D-glutamate ligase n=1 Tax=Pseudaquabacterium rugosum TaxID=2984194 RepID=A0ABU9B702_9BURK